ncbi:TonB-dependent receptor [uncultured Parabacteroides sp.]|uniref:TonB-dependent receptor n=1 Tax=uncultured Parabacteroides sp. TaxID=512312 RepID=UPI0025CD5F36|nr:TonB-dependent receptor [uncultured Parabacteroides sp.]
MNLKLFSILLFSACIQIIQAQKSYSIKGIVKEATSGEPIPYATVIIWNTVQGTATDSTGNFEITGVAPGSYRLQASYIGYKPTVTAEFRVANKDIFFPVELETASENLQEVNIVASPFRKTAESPLGLRVIGFKEIEKSAGGNRDISRVVQTFPGVASTAAFRNDLMVRGGGPSENRFFLDGVEIPNINHFSTQGASGGPVGIINPDFIREVNFYSAAFPAARGNALSSVLDFKLQDGNKEKFSLRGVIGASDVGLSTNGPIGKKTTYQVSVRRSYLQFLFDMIGLPFLPTFTDAQFKVKHTFDRKNELTLLGLGAIDNMKLNTGMEDMSEKNQYILAYLPVVKQKTYTLGAVYKHYSGKNIYSLIVSRSQLNNRNTKYKDNDESSDENLTLNYRSDEIENKLRSENIFRLPFIRLNVGGNIEYATYTNHTFQKQFTTIPREINYHTDLGLWKWGLYVTAIYESDNERFTASLGARTDANNYSSEMNNLLEQLSPRLSLSYRLFGNIYLNANAGRYYELPPYTVLGFKDNQGNYVNRTNRLSYIRSDQAGIGLEYRPSSYLKFTAEGFYKKYDHYPMSLTDSIPLASKGTDYGVLGNEAVNSTAAGRAYGLELMGRWYNYKGLTFIASYTYVRSEFRDGRESGKYIPSAWDNRHLFTFSGTYALPGNWDIGAKLRVVGGAPYTPYDVEKSSFVDAWDASGSLYYDYSRFNSERLKPFTQLDLRIDKTFYLKKLMIGAYIDLQNVLNSKYKEQDVYIKTGKILNPDAPRAQQRYELKPVDRRTGTLLPSIGLMIEL